MIPIIVTAAMSLGYIETSRVPRGLPSAVSVKDPGGSRVPLVAARQELRQRTYIDNRTLPPMRELIAEYWNGSLPVVLFGFASDASVVRGGASQTWMRILTDHGLMGLTLLATGVTAILWPFLRQPHNRLWGLLFLFLFTMSVYQRPVIWLPYATLLLICGAAVAFSPASRQRAVAPRVSAREIMNGSCPLGLRCPTKPSNPSSHL